MDDEIIELPEEEGIFTSEMNYMIVCEVNGYYKSIIGLFSTLDEAKQWKMENEAEFASYIIYKVTIDGITSPLD